MRRRSHAGRREARGLSPRRLPPRRSQRPPSHQKAYPSRSPSGHGPRAPRAPQPPRHKSAVPRACSTNRHRVRRYHLRDPRARRSRRVQADHHSTYVRDWLSQASVETIDEVRFQPTLLTRSCGRTRTGEASLYQARGEPRETFRSLIRGIRFRTANRRGYGLARLGATVSAAPRPGCPPPALARGLNEKRPYQPPATATRPGLVAAGSGLLDARLNVMEGSMSVEFVADRGWSTQRAPDHRLRQGL
jgi:hypothetical protein